MEPKWSQKGAKWRENGAPSELKSMKNGMKNESRWRAQLVSERSERASGAIDVTGMRVTCVTCSPCNALPVNLPRQVFFGHLFGHFFVDCSECFSVSFWMVFGTILKHICNDLSVLFSIKKTIDFSIDFPLILGMDFGELNA